MLVELHGREEGGEREVGVGFADEDHLCIWDETEEATEGTEGFTDSLIGFEETEDAD